MSVLKKDLRIQDRMDCAIKLPCECMYSKENLLDYVLSVEGTNYFCLKCKSEIPDHIIKFVYLEFKNSMIAFFQKLLEKKVLMDVQQEAFLAEMGRYKEQLVSISFH